MNAERVLSAVSEKCQRQGFESLSHRERVVWLVSWADFEVNLGGTSGYLYNSAGDHLPDLAEALETINCPKVAVEARKLSDALGALCNARDRVPRIDAIRDPANRAFLRVLMDDFDALIYKQSDRHYDALLRYIESAWPDGTP